MAIRTFCDICDSIIVDDLMDGLSIKIESIDDAGADASAHLGMMSRLTPRLPPTLDLDVHVGCLPEPFRTMFELATTERRELLASYEQAQDKDEDE